MSKVEEVIQNFSKHIEITTQNIDIGNLPRELEGLSIVQISDIHITDWNVDLIEHSIEVVNRLNPDIVIFTGDMICNGKRFLPLLTGLFKNINAKYGKYACLGNHDYSDGDSSGRIQEVYKKTGFTLLVNDSTNLEILGHNISIAGLDDYKHGTPNVEKMINNISEGVAKIFLAHNPINFKKLAEHKPDIVISGHTHGGQIYIPYLRPLYHRFMKSHYVSGLYKHDKSILYVNRGIGTALVSALLMNKKFLINTPRFNSKPEISVFYLKKALTEDTWK